jgi:hypothetical protein
MGRHALYSAHHLHDTASTPTDCSFCILDCIQQQFGLCLRAAHRLADLRQVVCDLLEAVPARKRRAIGSHLVFRHCSARGSGPLKGTRTRMRASHAPTPAYEYLEIEIEIEIRSTSSLTTLVLASAHLKSRMLARAQPSGTTRELPPTGYPPPLSKILWTRSKTSSCESMRDVAVAWPLVSGVTRTVTCARRCGKCSGS